MNKKYFSALLAKERFTWFVTAIPFISIILIITAFHFSTFINYFYLYNNWIINPIAKLQQPYQTKPVVTLISNQRDYIPGHKLGDLIEQLLGIPGIDANLLVCNIEKKSKDHKNLKEFMLENKENERITERINIIDASRIIQKYKNILPGNPNRRFIYETIVNQTKSYGKSQHCRHYESVTGCYRRIAIKQKMRYDYGICLNLTLEVYKDASHVFMVEDDISFEPVEAFYRQFHDVLKYFGDDFLYYKFYQCENSMLPLLKYANWFFIILKSLAITLVILFGITRTSRIYNLPLGHASHMTFSRRRRLFTLVLSIVFFYQILTKQPYQNVRAWADCIQAVLFPRETAVEYSTRLMNYQGFLPRDEILWEYDMESKRGFGKVGMMSYPNLLDHSLALKSSY